MVAAMAAAALSVLLGRGSNSVAGSVGLSLGGLVAADGLSFAGLVVAIVSPFAEVLGSPVVVSPLSLSFLQAAKAKTKQRARTRAMIFFVISVTSEKIFLHFSALMQTPLWSV